MVDRADIPIEILRSSTQESPRIYKLAENTELPRTCFQTGNVHVFAQHGMSKHLALWELKDLTSSNAGLTILDPKIADDMSSYMVSKTDPLVGLRNKCVAIYKV